MKELLNLLGKMIGAAIPEGSGFSLVIFTSNGKGEMTTAFVGNADPLQTYSALTATAEKVRNKPRIVMPHAG